MINSLHLLALSRPVTYVVIIALYMSWTEHNPPLMALYAVSAAFYIASSALVVRWIPGARRWLMTAVWLELGLAGFLNWVAAVYQPGGPMPVLFMPIVLTIALDFDRRYWILAMAVLTGVASLSNAMGALHHPNATLPLEMATYSALLVFLSSVGVLIRELREERERSQALVKRLGESQAALERAHRQLQDSVAQLQEIAVLEERQRLAREIHDGVAHSLTALLVQLQAGNRLLERSADQAGPVFARCEDLARESLREMRGAVRALHPTGLDQVDEASALQRLGRDFAVATGMEVNVSGDASLQGLTPDPVRLEHLYRIFQEALTNAHRHGQAQRVDAELTVSGGVLSLTICNDGKPPRDLSPGLGLRSMAERAQALGGSIRLESQTCGLQLQVTVPVSEAAVPRTAASLAPGPRAAAPGDQLRKEATR